MVVITTSIAILMSNSAYAAEIVINAEARVFNPDIAYLQPGDTITYTNMTSHNSVSIEGLIPEGATPWAGQLGESIKPVLDKEGVYAYVCQPHIGFGMMGLVVVGKPVNLEAATKYAEEKYTGTPFARIIGKLKKVQAK
jgi:Plastocyanin